MNGNVPVPTYEMMGFNSFLTKIPPVPEGQQAGFGAGLNFEQMQVSGNIGDSFSLGGNNVQFDGINNRIIINDGTNDRIIIGNMA